MPGKIKGRGNRAGPGSGWATFGRRGRREVWVRRVSKKISASQQQDRRITRISCHGSIETGSRLVVTRGWREGWMGSDCLIASF